MSLWIAGFVALHLSAAAVSASTDQAPTSPLLDRYPPAEAESIVRTGGLLGLSFSPEGGLLHASKDRLSGEVERRALETKAAERVVVFLSRLPKEDPEMGMAVALRSYLRPRMAPRDLEDNMFLNRDEEGRLVLTEIGRNALVDILTAADGQMLEPPSEENGLDGGASEDAEAERPLPPGTLAAVGSRAVARNEIALENPRAAFDGARHELGGFDWSALGAAVWAPGGGVVARDGRFPRPVAPSGSKGLAAPAELAGYAVDEDAGTVRVLIATDREVSEDHFKVKDPDAVKSEIYEQAGLSEGLLERHGARVVRAVDNIVTVDVPLPSAAALGLALERRGVESRPARVFKAARGAFASPVTAMLGGQFLPLPTADTVRDAAYDARLGGLEVRPQLVESRVRLEAERLRAAGMRGAGTMVGIIDSGIDLQHPDFKDEQGRSRIAAAMDFTNEGDDDVIGHGTHVGGTIGGSGAASDGQYRGFADQARFKVAKVFGEKGETDESVILAAMKWMASGDKPEDKVDVINMSLGGPGVPNKDPLSSMANRLTVEDNILVVAAAGNDGPWPRSVSSPGNARYALTVGGVNKDGDIPFFSSRGPIAGTEGNELYSKPDVLAVSGDVDFALYEELVIKEAGIVFSDKEGQGGVAPESGQAGPDGEKCIYAPGVIAPRSSKDPDKVCILKGNPAYRYMSGTSMATPMVAGMSSDVIGYLKANGADYDAFQVKALLMETAQDIGKVKEEQGAGLVSGGRLVQAVVDRVRRGIPVGNIAFALAMRMTSKDLEQIQHQTRYQMTELGLLDTHTGHLVNKEEDIQAAIDAIRRARPPLVVRRETPLEAV
ncbi:MAG: S8 family serine peptidase [Elusimicrobiota bacterium]